MQPPIGIPGQPGHGVIQSQPVSYAQNAAVSNPPPPPQGNPPMQNDNQESSRKRCISHRRCYLYLGLAWSFSSSSIPLTDPRGSHESVAS